MSPLTPLSLGLLMDIYVFPEPRIPSTPVHQKAIRDFEAAGVITRDPGLVPALTLLGRAWVAAILGTPLPRMAYLDAMGKEIVV